MKKQRQQHYSMQNWVAYMGRRNLVRWRLTQWYMRWKLRSEASAFDRWKKCTLEDCFGKHMQRCMRGYLGRARRELTARLAHRATFVQAGVRQTLTRLRYKQQSARNHWAARMVQKAWRGRMGRIRTSGIISSHVDTGRRMMLKRLEQWTLSRQDKAAWRIHVCYRKHLFKKRVARRVWVKQHIDDLGRSMEATVNQAKIKKEVYRQNLAKFYSDRKSEYDSSLMLEKQTKAEKAKILAKRRKKMDVIKKETDDRVKAEMEEKEAEIRTFAFVKKWEQIQDERCANRMKRNKHLLSAKQSLLSTDERLGKKKLLARIEKQLKVVLRRADDAKIPMEIPEGTEVAIEEILQMEVEAEKDLVRSDMWADGERIEGERKELKRKEIEKQYLSNLLRHGWAALTIQGQWKCWKARQVHPH